MILLKRGEEEPYENEDELRNVFIDSFDRIYESLIPNANKAKSFLCVKELDGVDAVIVDDNGSIFLVETKLDRNTDARKVVAQILDYCARFRKEPFTYFKNRWISKSKEKGMSEEFNKRFENGNEVSNALEDNWKDGNFHLLIVMDYLRPEINNVVELLRSKNLKIHIIELRKYFDKGTIIIIPEIPFSEPSFYYKKELPNDSKFKDAYSKTGLQKQIEDYISLFNEMEKGDTKINGVTAVRTPKYILFKILDNAATASLYINPEHGNAAIDFWCNRKEYVKKISDILKRFNITIKNIEEDKGYGKIGKWNLEDFSKEKFKQLLKNISSIIQNQS